LIAAILRSFNNKNLPPQIKSLLLCVDYVVVAINVDTDNRGEEKNGAYTKQLLKSFVSQDRIIAHPVKNWGKNPGSAAALNDAASALFYRINRLPTEHDVLLNISVESKITPLQIHRAAGLLWTKNDLAIVGISRQIYMGESKEDQRLANKFRQQLQRSNRLQYRIPQNTAAFWRADLLRQAGGFRTECDFSGLTIGIDGKEVPVAGMEDFPTLCHLVQSGYNWTMIKDDPIVWDLSDIKNDPARWQLNLNKMIRQERVMGVWAKKFFGLTLKEITTILKSKEEII